jgi:hypothetical protein
VAFPIRGKEWKPLNQIKVKLTKHRVNSARELWDQYLNVLFFIFPL